jgi:hypothetical protein
VEKQLVMKIYSTIAALFFLLCPFLKIEAQQDSVMYVKDSVIEVETDPTTSFFQSGEKVKLPAKTILITKAKKTITLAAFLKNEDMMYSDNVLADLDNDGKNELLISNFTGGAHCCDEIYIFKNIGLNKYQQAAKLFAGNTAISKDKLFTYNFYEQFGYFFTCFACGYSDTSDAAPVEIESITLKYARGKLNIIPGDKELRSTINDNLAKLGELPYEKLDDDLTQDNGLRKAFAMNLAVFHYSFGKNLVETQKLFNKYYKFPDAKKVWAAFVKELQYIPKESSL